jgi:hypothetical protein
VLALALCGYRAEPRRAGASGPLQRVAAQLGAPREVGVELLLVHGAKPHPCIAPPATPVSPQAARASSAAHPSTRLFPRPGCPPFPRPTSLPRRRALRSRAARQSARPEVGRAPIVAFPKSARRRQPGAAHARWVASWWCGSLCAPQNCGIVRPPAFTPNCARRSQPSACRQRTCRRSTSMSPRCHVQCRASRIRAPALTRPSHTAP